MEVVSGDNWSYKSCKAPVKSSPTNQHPVFLQAGCPSCRTTNSVEALKGNITFHGLAYPKLTRGLLTLSLTTRGRHYHLDVRQAGCICFLQINHWGHYADWLLYLNLLPAAQQRTVGQQHVKP